MRLYSPSNNAFTSSIASTDFRRTTSCFIQSETRLFCWYLHSGREVLLCKNVMKTEPGTIYYYDHRSDMLVMILFPLWWNCGGGWLVITPKRHSKTSWGEGLLFYGNIQLVQTSNTVWPLPPTTRMMLPQLRLQTSMTGWPWSFESVVALLSTAAAAFGGIGKHQAWIDHVDDIVEP
jgi:hypothetical protein